MNKDLGVASGYVPTYHLTYIKDVFKVNYHPFYYRDGLKYR